MAKAVLTKNSPFYVQFYVSKFCHLQCRMCNIVEANRDIVPFTPERIEQIADNLVRIGAGVVLLTGGEPFMRPDIDEIVRVFKAKQLDVRMQTAGLTSKWEKIAKCVEYGARDINVSIDSLDERLSDYLNGRTGSWREAIRTIAYISRTFPGRDSVCALGCVLSPHNIDEIEAVLDFATEIGWWLSLVPAHITTLNQPMNFRGHEESFKFSSEQFEKLKVLIDRLKRRKREGSKLFDSDDYLDSIYHFVTIGTPNWRHHGVCDSPNLYFAILPDGRFAPCCDYRIDKTAYVYDQDFPEVYASKEFRGEVRGITSACPGCNFGSFPEMSLSARSFSTIKERLLLQLRTKAHGIRPFTEDEMFDTVSRVRAQHDIYRRL
jgi:MoaA/NifB/PqqE/SkfB family radical SAM enzyme